MNEFVKALLARARAKGMLVVYTLGLPVFRTLAFTVGFLAPVFRQRDGLHRRAAVVRDTTDRPADLAPDLVADRRRAVVAEDRHVDPGVRGDLDVGAGEHAAHAAGERRGQRRLHLHRLDDRDDVAFGHLLAL